MKQNNDNKVNPYKISWIDKIPYRFKAYFLKFWFAGAVYYFAGWGIYSEQFDVIDEIVILGLVLGVVIDLLVNNILRFMETDKDKADRFILIRKKKFYTIFINVIYAILVTALISYTYHFINLAIIKLFKQPDKIYVGGEPFGFGLLFLAYDYLILALVNFLRKLHKKRLGVNRNV
jgi:hypothetical protein